MGAKNAMADVVESIDKQGKELKVWNHTKFGNVNHHLKMAKQRMEELSKQTPTMEVLEELN